MFGRQIHHLYATLVLDVVDALCESLVTGHGRRDYDVRMELLVLRAVVFDLFSLELVALVLEPPEIILAFGNLTQNR